MCLLYDRDFAMSNITTILLVYLPYVGVFFSFFAVILNLIIVNVRVQKAIQVVGNCLLTLDFSNPVVQKLKLRKSYQCYKAEIFLKKMIENLLVYKKMIPDTIHMNDSSLEETESNVIEDHDSSNSVSAHYSKNSNSSSSQGSKESDEEIRSKKDGIRVISKGLNYKKILKIRIEITNKEEIFSKEKEELYSFISKFNQIVENMAEKMKLVVFEYNPTFLVLYSFGIQRDKLLKVSRFSSKILSVLEKEMDNTNSHLHTEERSVIITITSFMGMVGYIESSKTNHYIISKEKNPEEEIRQRIKERFGKENGVYLCGNTHEEMKYYFSCYQVDFMVSNDKERRIYLLGNEKRNDSTEGKEWIYHANIQEALKNDENETNDLLLEAWRMYEKNENNITKNLIDQISKIEKKKSFSEILNRKDFISLRELIKKK